MRNDLFLEEKEDRSLFVEPVKLALVRRELIRDIGAYVMEKFLQRCADDASQAVRNLKKQGFPHKLVVRMWHARGHDH